MPTSLTTLPTETLELICENAWRSADSTRQRELLYRALAASHPHLHRIILRVAIRNALFDSTSSCTFYSTDVAGAAASFAGVKHSTHDSQLLDRLFERSHICLVAPLKFETGPSPHRLGPSIRASIDRLRAVVKDCSSFTLTSPSSNFPTIYIPTLFACLASFPSLTHLQLDVHLLISAYDDVYYDTTILIEDHLPSVTFLRLREHPRCGCEVLKDMPEAEPKPLRSDNHQIDCMSVILLEAFPNLRHLHLDHPFFLKDLNVPPTLETLTLEAPPQVVIQGQPPRSFLLGYNISAALKRGLMRSDPQAMEQQTQKTIVVHTGTVEPYSWGSVVSSCAEAGVRLIRHISYE